MVAVVVVVVGDGGGGGGSRLLWSTIQEGRKEGEGGEGGK